MRLASSIAALTGCLALAACSVVAGGLDQFIADAPITADGGVNVGHHDDAPGDDVPNRSDPASEPVPNTDPASAADAGAQDDGSTDSGQVTAATIFFDDFARPDGPIGNDWLEKTPGNFTLRSGSVKQTGTGSYKNLIVTRPNTEDVADVEVSVLVTPGANNGDPVVLTRIQPASTQTDKLVSYTFYTSGLANLYLDRDGSDHPLALADVPLSPQLVLGQSYTYTVKVTGTNPVHITGSVRTADGDRTLGMLSADDTSSGRIMSAGSVGFGSGQGLATRFDDFKRTRL